MKGRHHSEKSRRKNSDAHKGVKSSLWKGGISPENKRIRHTIEFRLWREAVFARDNWTCQKCKTKKIYLHPHHILGFANYPELRFAIDNGITLCENCHKNFHKKKVSYLKVG
jgi:5-methylcytosine-specific restriction endonuclease McrA